MGWLNLNICQYGDKTFLLHLWQDKLSMGGVKNKWGSNIYYYFVTFSLFHFFRNSQHPEKWNVF